MNSDLLQESIDCLDFAGGQLHDVSTIQACSPEDFLDKGDWLEAAKRAHAEKMFFVGNSPVVVFARCSREQDQAEAFSQLWCLSRPRILFLECEGELSVLDLAQKPVRPNGHDGRSKLKPLETLRSIQELASKLQEFHRDNVESGKLFEGGRFGSTAHRADNALIADLRTVRRELLAEGLPARTAHALIGRSVFVRYLEDRGVLTKDYYEQVASQSEQWSLLLHQQTLREHRDLAWSRTSWYSRALSSKSFAYALFRRLARDFNGDMFPDIDDEEEQVQEKHLRLLQDLLYGDAGAQKKLFFFSYKFDIVPLELISAIYEEFCHDAFGSSNGRENGVYYTPPVLAEFVLSRILDAKTLDGRPRVLDPACGSGIFLVEAFRRIVRHWTVQRNKAPSFEELKRILVEQIAGIEVSEEAVRITAFSLYLAMLHYLEPPSILEHVSAGDQLPSLVASQDHGGGIHVGNAFAVKDDRVDRADVVVGNPPWGGSRGDGDGQARELRQVMLHWCRERKLSVGNKEPSQAFLWRATELLKPGGKCALLTSAGVLFKTGSRSAAFRKEWMRRIRIVEVFNFSHVRKMFFKEAVEPFLLIQFCNEEQNDAPVEYWSPKQLAVARKTQAVVLSKHDRAYLVEQDLRSVWTWKTGWFGRHADMRLLRQLEADAAKLEEFVLDKGRGYELESAKSKRSNPRELLGDQQVGVRSFGRYDARLLLSEELPGPLVLKEIRLFSREELGGQQVGVRRFGRYAARLLLNEELPERLRRLGCKELYVGKRLLVLEGIQERDADKGCVIARYEDKPFPFSRSIHGIRLRSEFLEEDYLAVLGIFWSSLARYFFFNTTSSWGLWHHKILLGELLQLPMPQNFSGMRAGKVVSIVQKLRSYDPPPKELLHPNGVPQEKIDEQRRLWETELNEAVFDLYGLADDQRDLVRDFCDITLPIFYDPKNSSVPAVLGTDVSWMQEYAERFARRWKPYLAKDEAMRADLHMGASGNMIAMEFYPADAGDPWNLGPRTDSWSHVLEELGKDLPRPMGTSQILLDGVVHVVSNDCVIVAKRNVKRFWTRSLAWEDAEATLVKFMLKAMPNLGKNGGLA